MRPLFTKPVMLLLGFIPSLLFLSLLIGKFYPIRLSTQIPFFFDLIEVHLGIPLVIIFSLAFVNYLLMWLISKKLLTGRSVLVPPIIFSMSPWLFYLTFAGSFYVYLLSIVMLSFLGLLQIRERKPIGIPVFIIGSILAIYSSLFGMLIFPLLIILTVIFKFVTFSKIKYASLVIFLFCLPLIIAIFRNQVGFNNIAKNQITLFANPGLTSAVNQFQGESRQANFNIQAKLVENRYIYLAKFILLKVVKNITPSTFFTSQENLLMFSFASPIFFGLLIPFLYGAYLVINSILLRKLLLISVLLLLPSLLSKPLVDLNRLVLFEPVVIFIISLGIIKMLTKQKMLLLLCAILVLGQFFLTISDISIREFPRYERYFSGQMEIGKQ